MDNGDIWKYTRRWQQMANEDRPKDKWNDVRQCILGALAGFGAGLWTVFGLLFFGVIENC